MGEVGELRDAALKAYENYSIAALDSGFGEPVCDFRFSPPSAHFICLAKPRVILDLIEQRDVLLEALTKLLDQMSGVDQRWGDLNEAIDLSEDAITKATEG